MSVSIGRFDAFSFHQLVVPVNRITALILKLGHTLVVLFDDAVLHRLQGISGPSIPLLFSMVVVQLLVLHELG